MRIHNSAIAIAILSIGVFSNDLTYPIVGTGTTEFWGNSNTISEPQPGDAFYGQEPQFNLSQPSYTNNGDGTITDNITGLMWTQTADLNGDGEINVDDKITYYDAPDVADTLSVGGYDDWRVPSIKEIYSLMNFQGKDPSGWNGTDVSQLTPFIDDNYFDVGFGDVDAGDRIIDGQYVSTAKYVSTVMNGQNAMLGLNLVDGRIKGYPIDPTNIDPDGKGFYAYFVRGNNAYGINKFADNGDGTITDSATGLMWTQADSDSGMNWEDAFNWVAQKNSENHLNYNDWRLPTIKELQSILDYSRSPKTDGTAAIDPVFSCSEITVEDGSTTDFPFYWSNTTHENMMSGNNAAYMCFGSAYGWMTQDNVNYTFMDVHGAGAQRSDPKDGNPDDYPHGHGPQGDVIRVYNYIRLVRTVTNTDVGVIDIPTEKSVQFKSVINNNMLSFSISDQSIKDISINVIGVNGKVWSQHSIKISNQKSVGIDLSLLAPGLYFMSFASSNGIRDVHKFILK